MAHMTVSFTTIKSKDYYSNCNGSRWAANLNFDIKPDPFHYFPDFNANLNLSLTTVSKFNHKMHEKCHHGVSKFSNKELFQVLNIRWPLKKNGQYVLYLTEIHIPDQYKTLVSCDEKYVNQLKLDPGLDLFESTYLCSVQSTNSPHSQDMFDT